jgi:hypothetical protein
VASVPRETSRAGLLRLHREYLARAAAHEAEAKRLRELARIAKGVVETTDGLERWIRSQRRKRKRAPRRRRAR